MASAGLSAAAAEFDRLADLMDRYVAGLIDDVPGGVGEWERRHDAALAGMTGAERAARQVDGPHLRATRRVGRPLPEGGHNG
jgi:hypothetical protein